MSSPARPKALKAALIAVEATAQTLTNAATSFVFQYNPEKLVRTFTYLNPDGTIASDAKAPPAQGAPVELIYFTMEFDATDQLEQPEKNSMVAQSGLHPALATLESIMDPSSGANSKVILFYWGPKRVVPTRLVSMKVSEEAFDLGLNPIRLNIDLCMRVLPLSELKNGTIGFNACQNQMIRKGTLAAQYKQSVGTGILNQVTAATLAPANVAAANGIGSAAEKSSASVKS